MPDFKRNSIRRKKVATSSNVKFRTKSSETLPSSKTVQKKKTKGNNFGLKSFSTLKSIIGGSNSEYRKKRKSSMDNDTLIPRLGDTINFDNVNRVSFRNDAVKLEDIEIIDKTDELQDKPPEFSPSHDVYRQSFMNSMRFNNSDFDVDTKDNSFNRSDSDNDDNTTLDSDDEDRPKHQVGMYKTEKQVERIKKLSQVVQSSEVFLGDLPPITRRKQSSKTHKDV